MKRQGPLLTLLSGLVLAVVLLTLNATTGTTTASTPAAAATTTPSPSSSAKAPASPEPSASATKTAQPPPDDGNYAGRTKDRGATVAVVVRDGKAVAYVCDGKKTEAWLNGEAGDDGGLSLKGKKGDELSAEPTVKGTVTGTVTVAGHKWDFKAPRVEKPSGLYRATAIVRGVTTKIGWVVLRNGEQVGVATGENGESGPAPKLDVDSGTAVVDGKTVTAEPVSGTTGQTF